VVDTTTPPSALTWRRGRSRASPPGGTILGGADHPASAPTPNRTTPTSRRFGLWVEGAENVFYIEASTRPAPSTGSRAGAELRVHRAIDVKTGGYEAEYGRSTGGVINVITKSGGNEFHGTSSATTDKTRCKTAPSQWCHHDTADSPRRTMDRPRRHSQEGPAVFFGAYDRVTNSTTSTLPKARVPRRGDLEEQAQPGRRQADLKLTDSRRSPAPSSRTRATTPGDQRRNHSLNGERSPTWPAAASAARIRPALRRHPGQQLVLSGQVARHARRTRSGGERGRRHHRIVTSTTLLPDRRFGLLHRSRSTASPGAARGPVPRGHRSNSAPV